MPKDAAGEIRDFSAMVCHALGVAELLGNIPRLVCDVVLKDGSKLSDGRLQRSAALVGTALELSGEVLNGVMQKVGTLHRNSHLLF